MELSHLKLAHRPEATRLALYNFYPCTFLGEILLILEILSNILI
jgi:hypothetical protein